MIKRGVRMRESVKMRIAYGFGMRTMGEYARYRRLFR